MARTTLRLCFGSHLLRGLLLGSLLLMILAGGTFAEEPARQRVLLIGQGPDGHPWSTHEYMAGLKVLASLLQQQPNVQVIVTKADGAWEEGPELLAGADAAVLFVAEGAKWIQGNPERNAAFEEFAKRGGGLSVLHWGMGTKDAKFIAGFVKLFGGCHGGPDRKYKVLTTTPQVPKVKHPITSGLEPIEVKDEFYYQLKFVQPENAIAPILQVPIEGELHTVAWAWTRPDNGRSFGFSGLHFHENWNQEPYRRLVLQGVLWTLKREIPAKGISVELPPDVLELPPEKKD